MPQSRPIRDVPHYGAHLDAIRAKLAAGPPALFLDFDGTLAPIVPRPEDAAAPEATQEVVQRLALAVPVAVVSGRDTDDVRGRFAVEGIIYAGSHGFDVLYPDGRRVQHGPDGLGDALDAAQRQLEPVLAELDGVQLERKTAAIAVHYRNASSDDAEIADARTRKVGAASELLAAHGGKMITELKPDVDWHKGRVVEALLAELPDGSVPMYVGDDVTDEDAFAVLGNRGVSIVVRGEADDRETFGEYAAEDPDDARRFLVQLTELVGA